MLLLLTTVTTTATTAAQNYEIQRFTKRKQQSDRMGSSLEYINLFPHILACIPFNAYTVTTLILSNTHNI